MKKISLLSFLCCVLFFGYAQSNTSKHILNNIPHPTKALVNAQKPIHSASSSRSSITHSVTLDYDSFDRKWASQHPGFAQSAGGWAINKNFYNKQNLTLRYGMQLFDTIIDVFNNVSYPIKGTATQLRVDSFVTYLGITNNSGLNDTLVLSLFNRSSIGITGSGAAAVLSTTPLWADTFIVNSSLTGGLYSFVPNVTLPAGATFGIRYDIKGDTADHLTAAASYIEQCADTLGADTSKLGADKALYYVNYTAGTTNLSGINSIGFGTPTCGELWIQDWWIFPDITVISDCGTLAATKVDATCGLSNGSAAASVTGGSGTNTYKWSSGETTSSISGKAAGTYKVIRTSSLGCIDTATVIIANNGTPPTVTMANTGATCGGANGTATANGTAGTYVWNTTPVQTTKTATGLTAGSYSVTVTSSGCTASGSTTITNTGTAPTVSVTTTGSSCGGATGTATANGTAGTYVWSTSPAQTTKTATGLAAGSYTVTVTAAGCSASASGVVTNPGAPTVSVTAVNPTCAGKSDGSATASATGGTGTYTYTWSTSPAQTTATATGLAAGTYNVTVLATGCAGIGSVTVTAPAAIAINASATSQPTCSYSANGAATASATGGTGTLTYAWSNGTSGASISNGVNGTVKVFVVDTKGCKDSASVVFNTPAVTASASATAVKCFGGNDGTASVTAAGGTGVLNYAWSSTPIQTTTTATGLAAGPYSVTVKDANMCSATASTSVSQPATALSATTSQTGNSATVAAAGGTNPYTYTWSTTPVQTAATATGLTAGSYSVTVKDANNCTVSKSIVITSIIDAEAAGFSLVRVYPNPSNGAFTLNIEMNDASTVSLSIMDITGKVVYGDNLGVVSKLTKAINIQGMAAGVYSIRYTTGKGIATQKLIIE
jgi:hypothetical protein